MSDNLSTCLSNSNQLKEKFKKEILKGKQVEQLRSSLAEIVSNILVGDIDDKELLEQIKRKVIEKFIDAKYKLD